MSEEKEKVSIEALDKDFHETAADKPRSDISNLVATKLAIGLYAMNPLDGARHILEAILAINPKNWEQAGLGPEVREKAMRLLTVCYPLIKPTHIDPETAIIAFPFDPDDADLYLSFWQGWDFPDPSSASYQRAKNTNNRRFYLKLLTLVLRDGTDIGFCDRVSNAYKINAIPFAYQLAETLFRKYVNLAAWEQALAFIGEKKPLGDRSAEG